MAQLLLDSFDTYTTLTRRWTSVASTPSISAGTGRRGTASLHTTNSNHGVIRTLTTPAPGDATAVIAFSFKPGSLQNRCIMDIRDSGSTQFALRCNTDGTVGAYRGDLVTLLGTTSSFLSAGNTSHIEIKVFINNATGTVEIRVDGNPTPVLNLTGQDTQATANASWNGFKLGDGGTTAGPAGWVTDFDDLRVCDGTGTVNNDFGGDVQINPHYVTADGNSQNSTPSTGTDQYAMVDETDPNDDTDYNALAAAADKDTMVLQNLVASGETILGMQVAITAKKVDSGTATIASVIRTGGTDYTHPDEQGLSTSYTTRLFEYDFDPATSAQPIESNFNAYEAGYERVA